MLRVQRRFEHACSLFAPTIRRHLAYEDQGVRFAKVLAKA
jgi:hypothetical protein